MTVLQKHHHEQDKIKTCKASKHWRSHTNVTTLWLGCCALRGNQLLPHFLTLWSSLVNNFHSPSLSFFIYIVIKIISWESFPIHSLSLDEPQAVGLGDSSQGNPTPSLYMSYMRFIHSVHSLCFVKKISLKSEKMKKHIHTQKQVIPIHWIFRPDSRLACWGPQVSGSTE